MSRARAARLLLVVVAVAVGAGGVSVPAATVLAALAAAVVLERVVRGRRRGTLDAILVAVGALLIALVLLGLVLDVVPGGLTARSWSIGLGVVAIAALWWAERRAAAPLLTVAALPRGGTAVWSTAALVLTVSAVVLSVHSADSGESPPLQLSAKVYASGRTEVVVRGGPAAGRFELLATDSGGRRILRGPFDLAAGASVTTRVEVPADTRMRVDLATVGPQRSVRFVILDTTHG